VRRPEQGRLSTPFVGFTLLVSGLEQDAQERTRCGGGQFRWFVGHHDEEAGPLGSCGRRALTGTGAFALAGELPPPGGVVCLLLFLGHVRLDKAERISITDLAAAVSLVT
jgi:hypothetical protein